MFRSRLSLTGGLASVLIVLAGAAAVSLAASSNAPSSHLDAPADLRCDGQRDPLALAEASPMFSWKLQASSEGLHAVSQSAYRIQVADSGAQPRKLLWDSGVVHSGATADIAYVGPAFLAQHAYVWRVRVWDEQGHPSAWSHFANWTQAPDWTPQWIAGKAAEAGSENEALPLFRKSFSIGKPVRRVLLYASGLGQDELRVNGHKVGEDVLTPGWSDYRKTVYYDTYDVTGLVQSGANAMGVMLGNGMYRVLHTPGRYTKFVGVYGPLQCAVRLHVDLADGSVMDVVSDGTWKTMRGPITFSSTYGGEDYDARRERAGWDRAGFDDSHWENVALVNGPGGTLTPEMAPPLRVLHTYDPVKISRPRPGIAVYDLGQNFAGWPAISVSGPAGATVKLTPGELLNRDGTVSQRSSGGPQWFRYTLRGGGVETWRPRFSYYGFRYVQVEDDGTGRESGKARILSLRGEAVHSSSAEAGSFVSSSTLLNRIHTLILRAVENNAESLFTDCPHREKLGWLEETHLLAPSMLYDYDFAGLYAATARNIADAQTAEGPSAGRVPEIAPQYVVFAPGYGIFDDSPEWGSAAILAPWYVYQRSGDLHALIAQLDVMRRYADYLGTRAQEGIIDYGLGDWYDIGPGPPGYSKLTSAGVTATAIYFQDLRVLEAVTALAGKSDESRRYAQQAEAVRRVFNARFFDASQHRYDKGSQTAQAMPLVLGLVPEEERAAVLDALVVDIRAHNTHVTAGDIGYHYVVDALLDGGRSDVLLEMLERTDSPSYGYQLTQGATSLTEAWDANPASSQDHFMLGDAEEWFYRGLGGINLDFSAKGAERLILRPAVAGNLAWARSGYRSALGLIESSWQRERGTVQYHFTVPVNSTATIEVVSSSVDAVIVDGVALSKAPGVISEELVSGRVRMIVGSGHYLVRASMPD